MLSDTTPLLHSVHIIVVEVLAFEKSGGEKKLAGSTYQSLVPRLVLAISQSRNPFPSPPLTPKLDGIHHHHM